MLNIDEIADLINEDISLILEAPDSFYIPAFRKSKAKVDRDYIISYPPIGLTTNGRDYVIDDGDNERPATLSDLGEKEWIKIIDNVRSTIDNRLQKYEPYFVNQILYGNIQLSNINALSKLNNIIAAFVKYSKKADWPGHKDIYQYQNWKDLEKATNEFSGKTIIDNPNDSIIVFSKSYENNALSLVIGVEPEVTTYWLRQIKTPEAAYKYGKGTKWCTNVKPPQRGTPEYDECDAMMYLKESDLYIIEMQTPIESRRPIIQISHNEIMDDADLPIGRFGKMLKMFLEEAIDTAGDKMDRSVISRLNNYIYM